MAFVVNMCRRHDPVDATKYGWGGGGTLKGLPCLSNESRCFNIEIAKWRGFCIQNMFVVLLKLLTFQVDAHCTDLPCLSSALNEIDLYMYLRLL